MLSEMKSSSAAFIYIKVGAKSTVTWSSIHRKTTWVGRNYWERRKGKENYGASISRGAALAADNGEGS